MIVVMTMSFSTLEIWHIVSNIFLSFQVHLHTQDLFHSLSNM